MSLIGAQSGSGRCAVVESFSYPVPVGAALGRAGEMQTHGLVTVWINAGGFEGMIAEIRTVVGE
jgi:hypothetical protein